MLSAGQHTVVADYYSIPLRETLESDPITLTVQKRPPLIGCGLTGGIVVINSQVPFEVQANQVTSAIEVDWQDATYTITFVGAQTFTDTNLTADSEGREQLQPHQFRAPITCDVPLMEPVISAR